MTHDEPYPVVAISSDPIEAELLAQVLHEVGIPARVVERMHPEGSSARGLPSGGSVVELCVPRECAADAHEVLARARERYPGRPAGLEASTMGPFPEKEVCRGEGGSSKRWCATVPVPRPFDPPPLGTSFDRDFDSLPAGAPGLPRRTLAIEIAVVLFLYMGPNVTDLLVRLFGADTSAALLSPKYPEYLFFSCVYRLSTIALVCYLIYRSGEAWKLFGISYPRWLSDLALGFVVWLLAFIAPDNILAWALSYEIPPPTQAMPRDVAGTAFFAFSLLAGALEEELFFRGYLIRRLAQLARSQEWAIVVSALLFAVGHAYQGWFGVACAALTGLVCGAAFVITRRLWPLVLAHWANNLLVYWTL